MRRAHLINKFIDCKIDADRIAYNKKRKYCFRLIRKEKAYYINRKIRDETDNKIFWRKVQLLFREKVNLEAKIFASGKR